jgi:hypothetical protein
MPLQTSNKWRFSAVFHRYHPKTGRWPIIFNRLIQHMRQPISFNPKRARSWSGLGKKRESRSPPQLVDLVLVSW